MDKDFIMDILHQHKKKLRSFGVKKISLFGSYARGTAKHDSDIDFTVVFEEGRGNFDDYISLMHFLEDTFEKDIDLGKENLIRDALRPEINRTKIEAKI